MAHATTHTDLYPKAGVLSRLAAWAAEQIETYAETHPRMVRVRRLRALGDAQLDALGIARADIVHHVFRDSYYR